ncbi:UNVERIFIED_CONTAM: hypothetical protein LK11_16110 [Mumia flava]|uniref:hypothetical protein n=1 Tax=Mumia flava TaxID=1348852 RepID=UPI0005756CC3|nr:hypothetical protein [Mumia flava]
MNPRDVQRASSSELVGPGGVDPRVQPAAALLPGTADPSRLLILWFVRKSSYWVFFTGVFLGVVAAGLAHGDVDVAVDWASPSSVGDALTSTWAGLVLGVVLRVAAGWAALLLAVPLALAHEQNLAPRTNPGRSIGIFFDRLHLVRAFRELRWTHHVRQIALGRLGRAGRRLARLDPVLDAVNIATGVAAFVVAPILYAVLVD